MAGAERGAERKRRTQEGMIMKRARGALLWRIVGVVLAAAMLLVPLGCSDDSDTTTTAAPTTTVSEAPTTTVTEGPTTTAEETTTSAPTTTEGSTTTTTEALSSAETLLPDGTIKGMGYIDAVWEDGGVRYLSIDYVEFLSGEEAIQAAIEAGYIQPGEDLPNDYFIRNENPKLREFTVSPSVAITTSTRGGVMEQLATWAEFLSFFSDSPPEDASWLVEVPWWIIRDGQEIIQIDEQYLP
jgi:hypothetical protein